MEEMKWMGQWWRKVLRRFKRQKTTPLAANKRPVAPERQRQIYNADELKQLPISRSLKKNLERLKAIFGPSGDAVFRPFRLGVGEPIPAVLVFLDGMTDKTIINRDILKPLILESRQARVEPPGKNVLGWAKESVLTAGEIHTAHTMEEVVTAVLYGAVALLVQGQDRALTLSVQGWKSREIGEPDSEVLVRGPREGFNETLRDNTTLIRRRLRSPNLVLEDLQIGKISHTGVSLAYLKGVVSPDLVLEVKRRLERIEIDGILESGYLEEFIEDNPYSPFPQILHTERPDRVVAALLEGRVAILTDGTPFVLIVPAQIISFLTSPEDYYERFWLGTAIIWLRYLALIISLILPSLYIAVTTFHQGMLPTRLLISIAAAREGVPFPALLEALFMEFTFEVLREAGTRLPRNVGQAVSIVGALVIGQSAVQAGLVSPLMVIVVAVTGIASFAMPAFNFAITLRLLRFPLMLISGVLGLYGLMLGILFIVIHLAGLRSFGVPYLSSLAPLHISDFKDSLVRAPWWAMAKRPVEIAKLNQRRLGRALQPSPSQPGSPQRGPKK